MKQWKYIGKERKRMFGKWFYPGRMILNETKPNSWFKEVGSDVNYQNLPKPTNSLVDEDKYEKKRKELEAMKMSELRKIGYEYDARDTSKKELVNEIIQAMKLKGD